jgi:PIN domain nuclease of toxin-antitoxin system
VLLDTHALAWALWDSARIPRGTRERISEAASIWVSTISFYEIGQKVRSGKWPEMAPHLDSLKGHLVDQGVRLLEIGDRIALRPSLMPWTHRDPFDRLIAASVLELDAWLVSADAQFNELSALPNWRGRIW